MCPVHCKRVEELRIILSILLFDWAFVWEELERILRWEFHSSHKEELGAFLMRRCFQHELNSLK